MKKAFKKIAVIALLVFLLAMAGPAVVHLALGTEDASVVQAAYPSSKGVPQPGASSSGGVQPGASGVQLNQY